MAADHARFAITEVKVGRGTPWAAPLPWLVPPRVAMELLVTGEPIDAVRARDVGLVNQVVPLAELRGGVQALAEAHRRERALVGCRGQAHRAAVGSPSVWEQAEALWEPVYRSDDAQEGPRAFREKRAPNWQGR